jgi:aminopeptidase N
MKMFVAAVFFCSILFTSCNSPQSHTPSPPVERNQVSYLEESYARLRAQQIADVDYRLYLNLDGERQDFDGDITITFSLTKNNKMPVTVDFDGGQVKSVMLNGRAVSWQQLEWFIRFAPELFSAGKNTLQIQFSHAYATAGDGLHRYKDPQSGKVYLYTNFEPFNAHKMFPHFDQPDIKASYLLSVDAPTDWQVVSSTRESAVVQNGDKKHWEFPRSPRMSSYVFSAHAGPYVVWEDTSGPVPLRLFARQELASYVNYLEWFTYTQQAFAFYQDYFGYPYPFKKYDQIVVPDFNAGAMENIGAVTFSERFAGRGKKTYLTRMRHAYVVSHEMAHMWFGDLVTMEWWNGLWLNESFATLMGNMQLATNSEFKQDAWDIFTRDDKQNGYTADQLVTTHPIELPVANTAEAFTNFDGITYGKGAAVLRQLSLYVGEENFRRGVSQYLHKHAYGNTQLADFINEVGLASAQDLTGWSQEWLNQAGLNSITLNYTCNEKDATITHMELMQTAPAKNPTLRRQRVQLGFFYWEGKQLKLGKVIAANYQGATTDIAVTEPIACPAAVYPNYEEWGYAKVVLDNRTRQTVLAHMDKFDSDMRKIWWQNLWNDVEDARFPLRDYVQLVARHIAIEVGTSQQSALLGRLQAAAAYYAWMNQAGQEHRADLFSLEQIVLPYMLAAKAGSDTQRVLFEGYATLVHSPAGLENLRGYLSGKGLPAGFVLDQDRRWSLLRRLNQFAYKDYRELTEAESKKDPSDFGQQMTYVCEAIRPDVAIKTKWVKELLDPASNHKLATQRMIIRALFPANQTAFYANEEPNIMAALPELRARNNERLLGLVAENLTNSHACSSPNVKKLEGIRDQYADLGPGVAKPLSINVQEEQRCVDMMGLMQ